jgi:hypothetical protein
MIEFAVCYRADGAIQGSLVHEEFCSHQADEREHVQRAQDSVTGPSRQCGKLSVLYITDL